MQQSVNNNKKMALRDGLPVGVGYLAISFAFGLMASGYGISVAEAIFISALNVTSAGQLAALPIISAGGSFIELALTQLVINIRYSLMSISFSQKFDPNIRTRDRFILAYALTDEMFAVSIGKEQLLGRRYILHLMIFPILGWTLGTALGAIAGNVLPEILVMALSITMYAMFIAIIVPPAKKSLPLALCVLSSIALSCIFRYIPALSVIPDGFVIIIIALIVGTAFAILAPIEDGKEASENE